MKKYILCVMLALLASSALAINEDPHHNEVGFFDVRVCNWPERPRFMMVLFSTERFAEVERVAVYAPSGRHVGDLDMDKYRAFKTREGKDKRAFISHFDVVEEEGWYRAEIHLADSTRYHAKDYVILAGMRHPRWVEPANGAEDIAMPREVSWEAIPGAMFYQVYIRDMWDGRLVFSSATLTDNQVSLPDDMLQPGGYYSWRIHARDSDGNVLLGDFNHGSLSPEASFSVADQ